MLSRGDQYYWTNVPPNMPQINGNIIPLLKDNDGNLLGAGKVPRFENIAYLTECARERLFLSRLGYYGTTDQKLCPRWIQSFSPIAPQLLLKPVLWEISQACATGIRTPIRSDWRHPVNNWGFSVDFYSDSYEPKIPDERFVDIYEDSDVARSSVECQFIRDFPVVAESATFLNAYSDMDNIRRFWMFCTPPNVHETTSAFFSRMTTPHQDGSRLYENCHLLGPIPADGDDDVEYVIPGRDPEDYPSYFGGYIQPCLSRGKNIRTGVWEEEAHTDDSFAVLLNRHIWVNDATNLYTSTNPPNAAHIQRAFGGNINGELYIHVELSRPAGYFTGYFWIHMPCLLTSLSGTWSGFEGYYGKAYSVPVGYSELRDIWDNVYDFVTTKFPGYYDSNGVSMKITVEGVSVDTGIIHFPSDWKGSDCKITTRLWWSDDSDDYTDVEVGSDGVLT